MVGHRYQVLAAPAKWRADVVMRRGVLVTRFAADGEFFTVANTHLSPNRADGLVEGRAVHPRPAGASWRGSPRRCGASTPASR